MKFNMVILPSPKFNKGTGYYQFVVEADEKNRWIDSILTLNFLLPKKIAMQLNAWRNFYTPKNINKKFVTK
ncbi:hypothetical protein MHI39_00100 [Heyndrickxia sp. FSL K6-6286]|uniref:hypothetical protein n=1 Tax=Heyndrickxia sp. FSL K6-6286 TaxID=2921510 RepID=UPI00315B2190